MTEEQFTFGLSFDEFEYLNQLASHDRTFASLLGSNQNRDHGKVTICPASDENGVFLRGC